MTKRYASINDLPKKFTMTEFSDSTLYTAVVEDGKVTLHWTCSWGNTEESMDETNRILRHINSGEWDIIEVLEDNQRLNLPLTIVDGTRTTYVLTRGSEGKVTLVGPKDGKVHADYVTDAEAISFIKAGAWTVIGDGPQKSKLVLAVEEAKAELKVAEAALANYKPSYLA